MSNKIGVERELLERIFENLYCEKGAVALDIALGELRALLADQPSGNEGYRFEQCEFRESVFPGGVQVGWVCEGKKNEPRGITYIAGLPEAAYCSPRITGAQQDPVAWGNLLPGWDDDDRLIITSRSSYEEHARAEGSCALTPLYMRPSEQPAPVSVVLDERKAFEKWWRANMNVKEMDLHRNVYPMNSGWSYACHETNRSWMTWQARACLDKVKELNQ